MTGKGWWEEKKALSLERRAAKERDARGVNPGDAFLIVTEGTVTELAYFHGLRDHFKLSMVDIHIHASDKPQPLKVIATAIRLAAERSRKMKKNREKQSFSTPPAYDHVWAVIDTDEAARLGIWEKVIAAARKGKVSLAPSTPCFEFWLLMHFTDSTSHLANGDVAKVILRLMDHDCSTKASAAASVPRLIPHWERAVKHAEKVRAHHTRAGTPPPANPSTEVDHLVRALADSLPGHRRSS